MLIMRAPHHDEADLAPIALEAVRIHPIVVDLGLAGFPPESSRHAASGATLPMAITHFH
jgi:hypothetical protein